MYINIYFTICNIVIIIIDKWDLSAKLVGLTHSSVELKNQPEILQAKKK